MRGTFRADRHGKAERGSRGPDVDAPKPKPARPPRPPKSLAGVEREAWLELSREVEIRGTYTAADLSAFRLAALALASAYAAGPEVKASTRRGLYECASKLLGRFGLDPISRAQVDAPPEPDEASDAAKAFLFGKGLHLARG
jgi:hypothetical protein